MAFKRPAISAILIDLSGTLHIGFSPTPNGANALRRLREAGIPFRFCTNTSNESTSALCSRLKSIGFDPRTDRESQEVWTSLGAAKRLLEERGLKRCVVNCAVDDAEKDEHLQALPPAVRFCSGRVSVARSKDTL